MKIAKQLRGVDDIGAASHMPSLGPNSNLRLLSLPDIHGISLLVVHSSMTFWTIYHTSYAICLSEAGDARFRYRGSEHEHGPGALFFFEPGELHRDITVRTPCSYLILFVDPNVLDGQQASQHRFPTGCFHNPDTASNLRTLSNRLLSGSPPMACSASLSILLTSVKKFRGQHFLPKSPVRIDRAREYLLDNLERKVSLTELAKEVDVGPDHLLASFKATTGVPPHAFQIAARLSRVRHLLLSGVPAAEAATSVGFADQAHMIRHFKRAHGVTPGVLLRACSPQSSINFNKTSGTAHSCEATSA